MNIFTSFLCYMIGNTNLIINCAEAVLKDGNAILGIVSKSPTIRQWFEKKNIPTQSHISMDFFDNEFDYLFSIVNDAVIPKDILQLPRILSVNYHDAPLPRYAGLYATSWAIMNREKKHGISWHVMEESIDAGDILTQVSFPIMPQETALTLNLKCYQKALSTFELLIKNLQMRKITRHKQDATRRSYYGAGNSLPNLGVIDWADSAERIDSIIRALSFGDYPNEIGMPKIRISNTLLIIKKYSLADKSSNKLPGSIIDINEDRIQIATDTVDMVLTELLYLDGRTCPFSQLISSHLHKGSVLNTLNFRDVDALNIDLRLLAKNERYLVKYLRQFKENGLRFIDGLSQKKTTSPGAHSRFMYR